MGKAALLRACAALCALPLCTTGCDGGEFSLGDDAPLVVDGRDPAPEGGAPVDAARQPPDELDAAVDAALPDAADPPDAGRDAAERDAEPPAVDAAVGAVCSRRHHPPCPRGQFCRFEARAECGVADFTGRCQLPPESCDDEVAPVCGCDNLTYVNECEAHSRGISVHYHSDCAGAPGGELVCGSGLGCPRGLYCEQGGAGCDAPGVCRPSERVCSREIRPVCGCDGVTYDNACLARAVGRSIDHGGPCETRDAGAAFCGGRDAIPCPAGQVCDLSLGDGCDTTDARGLCRNLAGGGQCPFIYAPVCGCDDVTYSNLCQADVAGVSPRYFSECI